MSYQTTFTTTDVDLTSTWTYGHEATTATASRTISVTGLPLNATVTRAVLTCEVTGAGAQPSALEKCRINTTDVSQGGVSVRLDVQSNRDVTVTFTYQANRYVQGTTYTIHFKGIVLTIDYEDTEDEGYTDNAVLIPEKTITLFGPTADTSRGGIVLQPSRCTVTEEAAGQFELQMQHPMDKEGRWTHLLEDCVVKAPIPPYKIPAVEIPVGAVWKVKTTVTETPLYSKLPTYTRAETAVDSTTNYDWSATVEYHRGDIVIHQGSKYMSGGDNFGNAMSPGSDNGIWPWIAKVTPSHTDPDNGQTGTYAPGTVIKWLVSEEVVSYICVYNWKYVQVRDSLGHIGYAIADDLEETATAPEPYTEPARTIYYQLFRIYQVACDEVSGTVTVDARHISYDLQANGVFDCKLTEAEPATAIALLQGRLMNDDERLIACPFTAPLITADWSFGNPVQALLDPDDGLVAQLQARLLRDNADFFILPNDRVRNGPRLSYGVNLTGVTWQRDLDSLVTRIIPRAGDGDGGFLYLDELFVDSPYIGDYAVIHTEVLDSKYSVGQEIEKADGTTIELSRSDVIERMRQEAENRYFVDGADKVTVTLDVEFVLLGDTEEYRQYRNLQRVNLYDRIKIDTGSTTAVAQVIGYNWDCILARYNSITIGKVYSQARKRIPGYRMAKGTITYSKLAPGLIKWIKGET